MDTNNVVGVQNAESGVVGFEIFVAQSQLSRLTVHTRRTSEDAMEMMDGLGGYQNTMGFFTTSLLYFHMQHMRQKSVVSSHCFNLETVSLT